MVAHADQRDQVDLTGDGVDLADTFERSDLLGDLGDAGHVGLHEDDGGDHGVTLADRLVLRTQPTVVLERHQPLPGLLDGVVDAEVLGGTAERTGPLTLDVHEPDPVGLQPAQQLLGLLGAGRRGRARPRYDGLGGSASSTFYGIGLYNASGDVDSVAFVSEISFGLRSISVGDGSNTYTMSGLSFFNLGFGAEIRVMTLFSITPMLRFTLASMDSSEGSVTYAAERQGDGRSKPDFRDGEQIGNGRNYVAITIGAAVHFDLFGK